MRRWCSALLLLCGLSASHVRAAADADRWLLPSARATVVARDMSINGTPTTIYQFQIRQSVDEVRRAYRQKMASPIVEGEGEGWQLMSSMVARRFVTVRMKPTLDGQTQGTVSIADIGAGMRRTESRADFTMPAGSRRVIVTESRDVGVNGRVDVYTNTHSVTTNLQHLEQQLRDAGYQRESVKTVERPGGPVSVMQLKGARKDVMVTVARRGEQTSVVVNTMSKEGS